MLHNLRVDPRHTIDSVGSDHTQVGHVNPLAVPFLNHRHPPQTVHIPREQDSHVLLPRQRAVSRMTGSPTVAQKLPAGNSLSSKKIPGLLHCRPALKYPEHISESPSSHTALAQSKVQAWTLGHGGAALSEAD